MSRKHESILGTIGHTPVVRLHKLAPPHVRLFAKLESFNPMGSVKDRLALGLIEEAERSGQLKPGQTVIEATSGNTGIGLAMVCAQKGYPLVVVMAENFSVERRKLMRFLGARVVLTPASLRGIGMLDKARELAVEHGWFLCRQFENEANADIHSRTTAREIVDDFAGERLDWFVTGLGTGGTLKGVARVLADERPETRIAVCEPDNSPVLASGIPQPRREDGSPVGSHPSFRTHMVQGWAPDFIPKLTEDARGFVDSTEPVSSAEALRLSRELARQEGIFVGISAGATLAGALQIANRSPEGTTILCMLPDTGERYLTTPLFEEIAVEMTDEEQAISRSTPGQRFDVPAVPAPTFAPREASPEARAYVEQTIAAARGEVLMFALTYCEFCWSVRKLLTAYGIRFRTIDLDAGEFLHEGRGGDVRDALTACTGSPTVPQVFIGGEFVGGCTETLAACADGSLQRRLMLHGVSFDAAAQAAPASFLPRWLHSR